MADKTLASLTAATAATGGLFYGTQSGADRKFTLTVAGATLAEAADAAAQRTALVCPGLATANIFSVNGAASTPAVSLTGSPITGLTSTTTKPLFSIEPAGTTSNGWSTNGTMFGINTASGFLGDALHICTEGTSRFRIAVDTASGATFFGPNGSSIAFYNNQFHPNPVNNLRLGWPGVSGWTGLDLTSAAPIEWNSDSGLVRVGAAALQVTDGSSGFGSLVASALTVNTGGALKLGNAAVTGLTPAVVAGLLTKSVTVQDSTGATITLYGS